jgi:SAM-dependent methyltransferase
MTSNSANAYEYSGRFFDYIQSGAIRSARTIVPIVVEALRCRSVLDVGCGAGAWLSVYRELGVTDVCGVDGDYVDRARLLIPQAQFQAGDVSRPFDLGRKFDLVQSLEVAEHIPPAASRTLIANLAGHSSCVLFSAAVPGQGGENHVNEQSYEYWRKLFAGHGFIAHDFVRPGVRAAREVEPWYAYNSIAYVHQDRIASLPEHVRSSRVPDDMPIANVASTLFRLRTALLRPLPVAVVSKLAVLNRQLARWTGQ